MEFFHKRLSDGRLFFHSWCIEKSPDGDAAGDVLVERSGEVGVEGAVVRRPLAGLDRKSAIAAFCDAREAEGFVNLDPLNFGDLAVSWGYDGPWEQADDERLDVLADRVDAALKSRGLGGCTGQLVMEESAMLDCTVIDVALAECVVKEALAATEVAPFLRFEGNQPLEDLWDDVDITDDDDDHVEDDKGAASAPARAAPDTEPR